MQKLNPFARSPEARGTGATQRPDAPSGPVISGPVPHRAGHCASRWPHGPQRPLQARAVSPPEAAQLASLAPAPASPRPHPGPTPAPPRPHPGLASLTPAIRTDLIRPGPVCMVVATCTPPCAGCRFHALAGPQARRAGRKERRARRAADRAERKTVPHASTLRRPAAATVQDTPSRTHRPGHTVQDTPSRTHHPGQARAPARVHTGAAGTAEAQS